MSKKLDYFRRSKIKLILGVALVVQAITFVVLFFVMYSKKRSVGRTFVALATAGGISGAWLLISHMKDEGKLRRSLAMDACCEFPDADFADYMVDDDADDEDLFTEETVIIPDRED